MSRRDQGLLLLLTGLVAVRLVVEGTYDTYVRTGMRIPLLLASAVLIALGVTTAFRGALAADRRAAGRDEPPGPGTSGHRHDDDLDHDHRGGDAHEHRPWVGWLLALPLAVLVTVAPPALGADAAGRQAAYAPQIEGTAFPALPEPVDGAVELRLGSFVDRALWDAGDSLAGTPVRLTGFVVHDDAVDGGFLLTRFRIACCAADAVPVQVAVLDAAVVPDEDEWVEVTGELVDPPDFDPQAADLPRVDLTATSILPTSEPASPYE